MRRFASVAVLALAVFSLTPAFAQVRQRAECEAILNEALGPDQPQPNAASLAAARECLEVAKLREEAASLERTNRDISSSPIAFLLPWSALISGLVGLVVGIAVPVIGFVVNRTLKERDDRKREQERFLALMEGVGSNERTRQLAATSALLRRYEELASKHKSAPSTDMKTIQDVLVAILRDGNQGDAETKTFLKFLADSMVRAFGVQDQTVRRPEPSAPATKRQPPSRTSFSFADRDLQGAKLADVFWAGVFAQDVDFFEADLTGASLRDCWLSDSVFYGASMSRAVLRRADLSRANFMSASLNGADLRAAVARGAKFDGADLSGARLHGADLSGATGLDKARFDAKTTWDETTLWPDDRRPGAGYALSETVAAISA